MIQQLGYGVSGNIGVLGISDGSGGYRYYSDYTSALASAKSGDTIVQFANIVETRQISILLKDGININMNGFTYELSLNLVGVGIAAFYDGISDASGGVTCSIMNGTIKCIPNVPLTLGAAGDKYCLVMQRQASNITTNCVFIGKISNPQVNTENRILTGAVITGTNSGLYAEGGTYNNINGTVLVARAYKNLYLINCVFNNSTSTATAHLNCQYSGYLRANNCVFISTGGQCLDIYYGAALTTSNCTAISTAGVGMGTLFGAGYGTHTNLVIISTSSFAISLASTQPITCYNSFIYSSANVAIQVNGYFYGCNIISTAGICATTSGNTYINSTIDCQWNNTLGHAIQNALLVSNCFIKVANQSARCLNATVATNTTYINNIFQGSSIPVSGNVVQFQQKTRDLYNNILIG